MTFPSFLKRSSSDDDALDQALNAWASGERHSDPSCSSGEESPREAHRIADDALEFHRWADNTLRTDPAATGPAADNWNRVLRSTAQAKSRGGDMSSVALNTEPQAAIVYDSRPYNRGQISRYLNVAASVIIVAAVALGGWFATMQLNQPGGSNGQFALLGQSDESATCEVEPLSVDEVLAIVENPFGDDLEEGYLSRFIELQRGRVMNVNDAPVIPHNYIDQSLIESFQGSAEEEPFTVATQVANNYLACGQNGTIGQLFNFVRPFEIQRIVLVGLPVFVDEATVRASLEELLPMPASSIVAFPDSALVDSAYTYTANPNIDDAATGSSTQAIRYGMSEIIMMGVTVTDQNGDVVFQNDCQGRVSPAGPLLTTDRMRVIVGQSLIDEEWYVLAVIPE